MNGKLLKGISGLTRIILVAMVILLQVALIIWIVRSMRSNAAYLYILIEFIATINIFVLASRNNDSAFTIAWMLIILFLPVFGYLLYILWGHSDTRGTKHQRTRESIGYGQNFLLKDLDVYEDFKKEHNERKRLAAYLGKHGFPLYGNTECSYYPLGEMHFDAMLQELERAEKYIFLCYFIVDTGKLWDRFYSLLVRKAAEGVEIRLMYDDLGSISTIPRHFLSDLRAKGIQVVNYSPVHRFMHGFHINYRNHQKIAVYDGIAAYTGGVNLADEYANYFPKHGHWKDNGIRLEGDAVWSLTVTFLQMWDAETGKKSDYEAYRLTRPVQGKGFFQPFTDGPANNPDNPAEVMYWNMISNARDYIYITTPYLVIDNTMRDLLRAAANSGVDVRIITPKIWDHWFVHYVTRSNYRALLEAGVRIFEYTPGYIHAKTVLSDDDHCIIGSINMDHRSFNLHYENGVWICGAPVIQRIKDDIVNTLALSGEINLEEWVKRPFIKRFMESFLRIFAVLM